MDEKSIKSLAEYIDFLHSNPEEKAKVLKKIKEDCEAEAREKKSVKNKLKRMLAYICSFSFIQLILEFAVVSIFSSIIGIIFIASAHYLLNNAV